MTPAVGYLRHFGLARAPFAPDSGVIFRSRAEILESLVAGLKQDASLTVLTGHKGSGKTFLLDEIERQTRDWALVLRVAGGAGCYRRIAAQLKLDAESGAAALAAQVNKALLSRLSRPAIVLCDDAHDFEDAELEQVRQLNNLRNISGPGVGVVLAGAPAIQSRVAKLPNFVQRVSQALDLPGIGEDEAARYFRECLRSAGMEKPVLSEAEIRRLCRSARGSPGAFNALASAALQAAAEEEQQAAARALKAKEEEEERVAQARRKQDEEERRATAERAAREEKERRVAAARQAKQDEERRATAERQTKAEEDRRAAHARKTAAKEEKRVAAGSNRERYRRFARPAAYVFITVILGAGIAFFYRGAPDVPGAHPDTGKISPAAAPSAPLAAPAATVAAGAAPQPPIISAPAEAPAQTAQEPEETLQLDHIFASEKEALAALQPKYKEIGAARRKMTVPAESTDTVLAEGRAWLKKQPDDHRTMQLAMWKTEDGLEGRPIPPGGHVVRLRRPGGEFYGLFLGSYKTVRELQNAARSLPSRLQNLDPHSRKISTLKAQQVE